MVRYSTKLDKITHLKISCVCPRIPFRINERCFFVFLKKIRNYSTKKRSILIPSLVSILVIYIPFGSLELNFICKSFVLFF